jgi:hypothetical protein
MSSYLDAAEEVLDDAGRAIGTHLGPPPAAV